MEGRRSRLSEPVWHKAEKTNVLLSYKWIDLLVLPRTSHFLGECWQFERRAACSLCYPGMKNTTSNFPVSTVATTKGKEGPFRREGCKHVAVCRVTIYLHLYKKVQQASGISVLFLLHTTDSYREWMTSLEFYYLENALLTLMHKIINLKISAWHWDSHIHTTFH